MGRFQTSLERDNVGPWSLAFDSMEHTGWTDSMEHTGCADRQQSVCYLSAVLLGEALSDGLMH